MHAISLTSIYSHQSNPQTLQPAQASQSPPIPQTTLNPPPHPLPLLKSHGTGGEREEGEEKKLLQDVWSIKEIATYRTTNFNQLPMSLLLTSYNKNKDEVDK